MAEYLRVFGHVGFFCSWRHETFATITRFQTIERGFPMGLILLIVLAILIMGSLSTRGYHRCGYGPSGVLGLVLIVVLVLVLMGYIPRGF